jgi:hypothetical protein
MYLLTNYGLRHSISFTVTVVYFLCPDLGLELYNLDVLTILTRAVPFAP